MDLSRRSFFMTFKSYTSFTIHRRYFNGYQAMRMLLLQGVLPTIISTRTFLGINQRVSTSQGKIPFNASNLAIAMCIVAMFSGPFNQRLGKCFVTPVGTICYNGNCDLLQVVFPGFKSEAWCSSFFSPTYTVFGVGYGCRVC